METRFLKWVIFATALFQAGGCMRTVAPPPKKNPLVFESKQILSLSIEIKDPERGIFFDSKLSHQLDGTWSIKPSEKPYSENNKRDLIAHHRFLDHLLDNALTLEAAETVGSGNLMELGLQPPIISLIFELSDQSMRLDLGTEKESLRYARFYPKNEANSNPPVILVRGALLSLLLNIQSLNSLRLPTLTSFLLKEIQEVETNGKRISREHPRWTESFEAWLDKILHIRFEQLLDWDSEGEKLKKWILAKPDFKMTFYSYQKDPVEISIRFKKQIPYAVSTERPLGVFKLYSKGTQRFLMFKEVH